jgi:polyhydroxybutyrate depolymerase
VNRGRKSFSLVVIVMLAILRAGASAETLGPGSHRIDIQYGGLGRNYIVHVPPQISSANALPVILNFHGAGSNAEQEERYSGMDATADREGFVAVYPNGTGRGTRALTWNAGGCCAYAERNKIDDVGFTKALLDDLTSRVHIDRTRVYATGISNGGMMAFRLAVEASDRIAAIAPVEGALMVETSGPARPMPLIVFHSLDDPWVPYRGSSRLYAWFAHLAAAYPAVEETIARWRAFDRCPAKARAGPVLKGAAGTRDAGNSATRYAWGSCACGTEIVLWKLTGSGHVWPGAARDYPLVIGQGTWVIDANAEMWKFFRNFALPLDKANWSGTDGAWTVLAQSLFVDPVRYVCSRTRRGRRGTRVGKSFAGTWQPSR